ncbi:MAG: GNAT family N-acetyltransferase [Candidatus Pacearchaeota archaeon]
MKALTIKQPWAELILRGEKIIELRKWKTNFRGEFLIHSSKEPDADSMKKFEFNKLPCGYILGKVNLTDIKKYENEEDLMKDSSLHLADAGWGDYGFILSKPKRVAKVPYSGQLSFWNFKGKLFEAKPAKSEEEISKITSYLASLNLDYPNYLLWVKKCKKELISGYKQSFYVTDKKIIGVIIFQPHKEQENVLEIKHFSIEKNYWDKGIGSLLLDLLEDYFRKTSFKNIRVDTHEENTNLINFFKRKGFKTIKKEYLYNPLQKEIILQK